MSNDAKHVNQDYRSTKKLRKSPPELWEMPQFSSMDITNNLTYGRPNTSNFVTLELFISWRRWWCRTDGRNRYKFGGDGCQEIRNPGLPAHGIGETRAQCNAILVFKVFSSIDKTLCKT